MLKITFLISTLSSLICNVESYANNRKGFISVADAGISGDGVTDVTARLQKIFTEFDTVFFPKGNFIISSGLKLKRGQVITGNGLGNLVSKSNDAAFNFFEIASKEKIRISKINFKAKAGNKNIVYAINIVNSKSINISNVSCENAGLLLVSEPFKVGYTNIGSYRPNNVRTGSSNIYIDRCNCIGAITSMQNTSGVIFYYADNWKITNSTFKNYQHGVQWWGGDSNPERNGDTANPRKARNGIVENVIVDNIIGGGIWGSMGQNILVKNCKVTNVGDVGIDFEGCFNSRASGNIVKNCKNGCLATFHYNKNISFLNNVVSQTNPANPLACIFNSAQRQDNGTIRFTSNKFYVDKGVGVIYQLGPSNNIIFEKNTLLNVALNLAFNNNRLVNIKNNTLKFSRPIDRHNFAIKAGETNNNGKLIIEGNKIISTIKQPPHVYAINPYQTDYNSSPINIIKNNTITGISNKYKVEWGGTNAGVTSKTYIYSPSKILLKDIKKLDGKGKPSEIYLNDIKQ